MSDNGFVYVLINPSMIGMVKIGKTVRDPKTRANELSSTTGVPTPFIVVYESYFESCADAEIFVHTYLENKGYRVSKDREFFEIEIKDAIDAVIKAKEHFGEFQKNNESVLDKNNETEKLKPHEEVFNQAEAYYYGHGDEIQDYDDAMKYYLKAIKLGSIKAYRNVGIMYRNGEGVRENDKKALKYFKDGANKGNTDCYAEMALLYCDLEWCNFSYPGTLYSFGDKYINGTKMWKKYFELSTHLDTKYAILYIISKTRTTETIDGVSDDIKIKNLYISDIHIEYIDKLLGIKNDILQIYSNEINSHKNDKIIHFSKAYTALFQEEVAFIKIVVNSKEIRKLEEEKQNEEKLKKQLEEEKIKKIHPEVISTIDSWGIKNVTIHKKILVYLGKYSGEINDTKDYEFKLACSSVYKQFLDDCKENSTSSEWCPYPFQYEDGVLQRFPDVSIVLAEKASKELQLEQGELCIND